MKNIVINGDMSIAQRSTSVASITTSNYYTVDRYQLDLTTLGTWTQSQSTDVPSGQGFGNSLKMDCTTADASPASSDKLMFRQSIEGQNLQYLKKGTANAESTTLSFWVKSTKTGTFICELQDVDNTRAVSGIYTVITTNTWEFKTITFPADATGAFSNDNGESLRLNFWLGGGSDFTSGTLATTWSSTTNANRAVGQVNCADSTSNDWLITGVQLEAGTTASDFEFLPVDVNLARCQRYYQKSYNIGTAPATSTNVGIITFSFGANASNNLVRVSPILVSKRANPTIILFDSVGNSGKITYIADSGGETNNSTGSSARIGEKSFQCESDYASSKAGIVFHYTADAEL
jgi:hypothetical protein